MFGRDYLLVHCHFGRSSSLEMNKSLIFCLTVMLCAAIAMAGYRSHYYGGYKGHLGGYAYRPVKYVPHITYRKPVVHHATPIIYAHKSYSKPHITHYIKPSYHHEVPHHAPVYHSKPVYYLGGHTGHGLAYKPAIVHGHGLSYAYKGHHY